MRDARDVINTSYDVRTIIENQCSAHHGQEALRREEYDNNYGPPSGAPMVDTDDPKGSRPFTARPRAIQWPVGFKITGVEPYDGKVNPEQWLQLYAITVHAVGEIAM